MDEGGELLTHSGKSLLDFAQVDGDFIHEDQGGFISEEFSDGVRSGRNVFFIGVSYTLITAATRKLICHFAPKAERAQAIFEGEAVSGIAVLAVERSNSDFAGR